MNETATTAEPVKTESTPKPVKAKATKNSKPKVKTSAKASSKPAAKRDKSLITLPQTRILRVLAKGPCPRNSIAVKSGFTPISGTVSRALNGSKPMGMKGLYTLKLIDCKTVDVDGSKEEVLVITPDGRKAFKAAIKEHDGKLRKVRDRDLSLNTRYAPKKSKKK